MSPHRRRVTALAVAAIGFLAAVRDAQAADTADSLLADLPRLAAVQEGCKANAPWATEALCREAAQAIPPACDDLTMSIAVSPFR